MATLLGDDVAVSTCLATLRQRREPARVRLLAHAAVAALAGLEHGLGRTVPLWAFGFLYRGH